ncbi:MAG: ribbon-helix-helix domain-containing protein [Propionibacteriaceae bacterium]|nr:ribbon-helix-helix domain-containing protein [Propionibacteriaceae bacterium]
MSQDVPASALAAIRAEIAADTDDEAGAAYRDNVPAGGEWTRPNRGGRPSLSGHAVRSPQIGVRLPVDLRDRLTARAAHDGVRESEVVREALEAFLTT